MVAEESYQDLLIDRVNQSVIITGESGAGKTEATKLMHENRFRYISIDGERVPRLSEILTSPRAWID